MQNSSAKDIIEKIKASKNILINMDTRTDYDALCSSIVMSKYIEENLNIKTTIIHAGKIGEKFDKFFKYDQIKTNTDIDKIDLNEFDLIIFLDSGSKAHISLNEDFQIPGIIETINIDHHKSNELFGTFNYVYHYGSCCSVLYEFFKEIEVVLPLEYLNIIAIGLITDSASFKTDSCTAIDFKIAAELMENKVNIAAINTKLITEESIDQIRFKEIIYKNLKINEEKRYAYTTITLNELKDAQINIDKVNIRHSELISYIQNIDIAFAVSEVQSDPKYIEISLRAKTMKADVSKIAQQLGGGGHAGAAGVKLYDVSSVSEAVNKVLDILNN